MRTEETDMATQKVARLKLLSDGTVLAQSSRSPEVYRVRLGDTPSCECIGWTSHGHCYHLTTAMERYAAFYTPPPKPANVVSFSAHAAARRANALLYADEA
jgi:hypothetical protein